IAPSGCSDDRRAASGAIPEDASNHATDISDDRRGENHRRGGDEAELAYLIRRRDPEQTEHKVSYGLCGSGRNQQGESDRPNGQNYPPHQTFAIWVYWFHYSLGRRRESAVFGGHIVYPCPVFSGFGESRHLVPQDCSRSSSVGQMAADNT